MKYVIIRCRKCWEDVALQKRDEPVKPCPKCGRPETYVHAVVVKGKISDSPGRR